MSRFPRAAARRLPALLVLGLLALLLWGQCGGGARPKSTRPAVGVDITSTDSLTSRPATLFLTVTVTNNTGRPVVLREASGTLQAETQDWPFTDSTQLRNQLVPARSERRFRLIIPLVAPPKGAHALAALQAALATGSREDNGLRMAWRVSYSGQRARQAPSETYYYSNLPPLKSNR